MSKASGPLDEERHVDATFEEADLPAAERLVDLRQTYVGGRPVVGREEDERVLFETVLAQRFEHTADAAV